MLDHDDGSGGHHLVSIYCVLDSFPILYMHCHLIPAAALWVHILLTLFTDEETEEQRNELPKFISS